MATGTRARGRHAAALSTRRAAMQRPLWHKLVAWALALALAGAAATLVVGDEQPASGAPDALGSADRARLAVAGLAGLSLFLIATLHQERKGESAEGFAIAGAGASTAAAVSCAGLALVSSAAELAAVRALALVLIGSIAALSGVSREGTGCVCARVGTCTRGAVHGAFRKHCCCVRACSNKRAQDQKVTRVTYNLCAAG